MSSANLKSPRATTSLLNMTEIPMQALMNRLPPSAIATLGDVHSTLRRSARRELNRRMREPNISSNGFVGAAPSRVMRLVETGRWPSDVQMRNLISNQHTPFEVHEYLHKRFAVDRGEYPYETKYLSLFMVYRRTLTDFLKMFKIIDVARVSPEQAVDIVKELFRHNTDSKVVTHVMRTLNPVLPRVRNVVNPLTAYVNRFGFQAGFAFGFEKQSNRNRYIRHLDNTNLRRLLPPAEFDNTNAMYLNSDTMQRLTKLGYPIRPTSMVFARDFYTKSQNNQNSLMGMATLQNTPESRTAALDRLLDMPKLNIRDLTKISIMLRDSRTRPTMDNVLRFILLVENFADEHNDPGTVAKAKTVFQQMVARNPNLKTDRIQLNATTAMSLKRHLNLMLAVELKAMELKQQPPNRIKISFYADALRTLES